MSGVAIPVMIQLPIYMISDALYIAHEMLICLHLAENIHIQGNGTGTNGA